MGGQNRLEPLKKKGREQGGQALTEYALIFMFIVLVAVGALTLLGIPINGFYTAFNASL
jgi:Flp pilus assembly pilin Flp